MTSSNSGLAVAMTTIQAPTPSVHALVSKLSEVGARLYVAGDRKGPAAFDTPHTRFLSLKDQQEGSFELGRTLPVAHYTRKNVAYLEAIADGADCLYETDDDNAPLAHWRVRAPEVDALAVDTPGWCNVYRHFSPERIWPRGLPLDALRESFEVKPVVGASTLARAAIQQGLANGSPDVDAVWRLVLDRPIEFEQASSLRLAAGTWCPFNSQSTWWWPEAFPLLYLPSHCSFRMTDIWRSFIAQRCLWELGQGVVFHAAEVFQERNEHDLMRDFVDEVPGYRRNRELAATLETLPLESGAGQVTDNLRRCYEALVAAGFFDAAELELVASWCSGLEQASK
jgi:hypothetical protein